MKQFRLWVIALAIKRIPQLVATLVQIISGYVVVSGMEEGAAAAMWKHVTAALVILLTASAQWVGSKWAGDTIKVMQSSDGVKPDGLPDVQSAEAARRNMAPFQHGRPAR